MAVEDLETQALHTCYVSANVSQHSSPVQIVLFDRLSKKRWTGEAVVGCNINLIGGSYKDVVLRSLAEV